MVPVRREEIPLAQSVVDDNGFVELAGQLQGQVERRILVCTKGRPHPVEDEALVLPRDPIANHAGSFRKRTRELVADDLGQQAARAGFERDSELLHGFHEPILRDLVGNGCPGAGHPTWEIRRKLPQ